MITQIYSKEFGSCRKRSGYAYERDEDVRNRALDKINEFFQKQDGIDIVNIVESWFGNRDYLKLIVYYKKYI